MDEQHIHINIPAVQRYASYLRNTARAINQKQESLISEVGRVSQYWRDDDYQRFRSDILPVIRELAAFQRECIAEAMRLEEIARAATQVGWGKGLSRITLENSTGNLEWNANQQEGDNSGREYTTQVLERYGPNDGQTLLDVFNRIADIPGANCLMEDLLSTNEETCKGALSELGYAAKLRQQGVELERLSDRIDGKKAGDIVTNDRVIDVKDYEWNKPFYHNPSNIESIIDDFSAQVQLYQQRYPDKRIAYAFTDLDAVPQQLIGALRAMGVEL